VAVKAIAVALTKDNAGDLVADYDVVLDGKRHERAAWVYEAPRPSMKHVAMRFGFWDDVEVG